MMAKEIAASRIKKLITADKLAIGTEQTIKQLRQGNVTAVVLSSNCPQHIVEDVTHYASFNKIEVILAPYPNEELGVICKKPYSISVLSVLKS